MKQEINYNIHDILKFKIIGNKNFLTRELNLEYKFFEVSEVNDPDIILNICRFMPSNDNCYVVDHKYHIKENFFYCKDMGKGAKWEVEIFGFEHGNTTINFNINISGIRALSPYIPFIPFQNFLLKPLIEYKLSKKGYFFIHSAAVSKDNKAYLLAGRGGSFKTTLALEFMRKHGFGFLGDDGIIIHKNKILCYPVSLIMFNYIYEYLPTENLRGFLDKIRLLKYTWNNYDRINNLRADIVKSSDLKALFFIVKKNSESFVCKQIDLNKAIDKLIINSNMEITVPPMPKQMNFASNRYLMYMSAYSYVFPNSQIATYWNDLGKKLRSIFEKIPIYEIELPSKYNSHVFDKLYEYIHD